MKKEEEHSIIRLCLMTYGGILFALSTLTPVFDESINEAGKFSLLFLQDTSFAWMSGAFIYYFGKAFLEFVKKRSSSILEDKEIK